MDMSIGSRSNIPLTQIRRRMKDISQEQDGANLKQFTIINQKSQQHILQINLIPATVSYLKGTKLYTNTPNLKSKPVNKNKWDFFNNFIKPQQRVQMVINDTTNLQIIGAKHRTKNGQILILNLSIYKDSIYYNPQYLLSSRKQPNYKVKHATLTTHALAQYKNKVQNIFDALDVNQELLVLQSDSVVIQKYLAHEEQFCIYDKESLIAFSKSVQLQELKGNILKTSGPGWIFFQTAAVKSQANKRTASYLKTIVVLSLFLMLLEISLVTML